MLSAAVKSDGNRFRLDLLRLANIISDERKLNCILLQFTENCNGISIKNAEDFWKKQGL